MDALEQSDHVDCVVKRSVFNSCFLFHLLLRLLLIASDVEFVDFLLLFLVANELGTFLGFLLPFAC